MPGFMVLRSEARLDALTRCLRAAVRAHLSAHTSNYIVKALYCVLRPV
jgi:hypothetical protein